MWISVWIFGPIPHQTQMAKSYVLHKEKEWNPITVVQ